MTKILLNLFIQLLFKNLFYNYVNDNLDDNVLMVLTKMYWKVLYIFNLVNDVMDKND